jgi:hypothetical protein
MSSTPRYHLRLKFLVAKNTEQSTNPYFAHFGLYSKPEHCRIQSFPETMLKTRKKLRNILDYSI